MTSLFFCFSWVPLFIAGCLRFQCVSQCPNLYWTVEVGIQPHISSFPCKTSDDSRSCHGKNTLRYGCVELDMQWIVPLFPGWRVSLCAPAILFQYSLGVWNLLNATVTNVEILHSAARSFTFTFDFHGELHFHSLLRTNSASALNAVIELEFYMSRRSSSDKNFSNISL